MEYLTDSIAVALLTQGKHRFFVGSMFSNVLAKTCFVTNREEDQLAGFQRTLNEARAQDIAEYIDTGFGTIPTSIILSAQDDAELNYDSRKKTMSFRLAPKAFKVIDGQHRVWGFGKARTTIRVPVVIYEKLSLSDEARLFVDVNTKQKPVPRELVLDIQRMAKIKQDVEGLLNEVFDLFHAEPDSPLFGKTSPFKKKAGAISRVTFHAGVRPLLKLFENPPPARVYQVVAPYLAAVNSLLGSEENPIDISSPIVFRAYLQALPQLLERSVPLYGQVITVDQWLSTLEGIESLAPNAYTARMEESANRILAACKRKLKL